MHDWIVGLLTSIDYLQSTLNHFKWICALFVRLSYAKMIFLMIFLGVAVGKQVEAYRQGNLCICVDHL